MNEITFENIRCFYGQHSCPIKPITILLGENSTGKTTFLAVNRIAWDIAEGDLSEDLFNEEPFMLGSYDQIASYRGGQAGRAKSFSIGIKSKIPINPKRKEKGLFSEDAQINAKFIPKGSQPIIDEWNFACGSFSVNAKQSTQRHRMDIEISTPKGKFPLSERIYIRSWLSITRLLRDLPYFLSTNPEEKKIYSEDDFHDLRAIIMQLSQSIGERPFAFAPIRTRPQRTYDPLKDIPKPEGSHVPMVLAKMFSREDGEANKLVEALNNFGEESGLYKKVEVKRKGNKESDPFQITVKIMGPSMNLVDVGYGVSQVLPIVVDVLRNKRNSSFLLQQPEIHLHPKAQAELASFFAALAKTQNKRFIIETHSDYLIDRLRVEIKEKKFLKPDDVEILYFEKGTGGVKINCINIDEKGNLIDTPPTYRQFFLKEENRLFGI